VDDGSTPSLEPVVNEFNDERIIFIRHEQNRGAGAAHNTGIKVAKYDWIAFICHDDEWLPKKLEKQFLEIKNRHNDDKLVLIYSDIYFYNNNVLEVKMSNFECVFEKFYENSLSRGFIYTSTIIVRKKSLIDVGMYSETGVLIDWDLYIKLSLKYNFHCINEKLVNYYSSSLGITHPNNLNNNPLAGNDLIKIYYKWKIEIYKYRLARKSWSIRWNAIAKWYLQKNQKKQAFKAYWEAIKLNSFWRGNYFDLFKLLLKIL
jgi:glycosyltransferase involved in cell wall biosynthesis